MQETKNLVCIVCPVGCSLEVTVEGNEVKNVTGNKCKRGIKYAQNELLNPTRTITSTVRVEGGVFAVCPVRTDGEIPKELIFKCMEEINNVRVKAPVDFAQVVVKGVAGTDVNVVTSRDLPAEE